MSRKLYIIALTLLAVAITGCQKDDSLALKLRSKYTGASAKQAFCAVTATGSWSLSVEYPAGQTAWLSVNPSSGSGSKSDIILNFSANDKEEPRLATLVLKSGATTVRKEYSQSAKTPEPVMGNYGYDVAGMDWLELPATTAGDGLEVLVHNMEGGKYISYAKNGIRNWSCYWDYKEHLSLWVAYPLNSDLRGAGSRTDAWGLDPMLPDDIQPDIRNSSYGGGWSRGHQLPSADRLNYDANVSTFYPTNMTPQEGNFNGAIWADLEGKVRSYAKVADTLYVVTGCLYKDSNSWTGTSTGFAVRIPTHYFKALLYNGPSTMAKATDGYLMAGFLLPHSASIAAGNCLDYRMSIDQLEQETGIDFFPNLERKVPELSKELEAAEPNAKFWK